MKYRIWLAIVLIFTLLTITACSARQESYEPSSMAPAAEQNAATPPSEAAPSEEMAEYDYSGEMQDERELPLLTPSTSDGTRMVYTAELHLQTIEFDKGTRDLLNTVREMGGHVLSAYVQGRSLYTPDVERSARYILRIPSDNLADFLVTMEDNYNLWQMSQESQDITRQYAQTDSQLDYLREQEASLQTTLESTEDAEQRLAIEQELAGVRAQIAASTASVQAMESDTVYSNVTIHMFEVLADRLPIPEEEETPLTFSEKLSRTTNTSMENGLAFLQGVLLFFIAALPALIVLAVMGAVAWLIYRWWKKRSAKSASVHGNLPQQNNGPHPKP